MSLNRNTKGVTIGNLLPLPDNMSSYMIGGLGS